MPRTAIAACLLSLLSPLVLSCGGSQCQPATATPPPPATAPPAQAQPDPPAPTATVAEPAPTPAPPPDDSQKKPPQLVGSGSGGESTGRSCSVTDSNGPEAGGERVDSCPEGERCVCDRQAGYSCAGTCHVSGR